MEIAREIAELDFADHDGRGYLLGATIRVALTGAIAAAIEKDRAEREAVSAIDHAQRIGHVSEERRILVEMLSFSGEYSGWLAGVLDATGFRQRINAALSLSTPPRAEP